MRAVPAIGSAAEGGSPQVASWLVPLWLLCVAFIATTAWEAQRHVGHYEGGRHCTVVVLSSGNCLLGIITTALMFSAVVILSVYCTSTAPSLRPKASYHVYDDVTLTPARMFMPAKARVNVSDPAEVSRLLAATAAAGGGDANTVFKSGRLPERPGDAGRWLLPDADSDWDDWAQLLGSMHIMTDLWAAYTTLQGVVLVLLVFRWVYKLHVTCTHFSTPVCTSKLLLVCLMRV